MLTYAFNASRQADRVLLAAIGSATRAGLTSKLATALKRVRSGETHETEKGDDGEQLHVEGGRVWVVDGWLMVAESENYPAEDALYAPVTIGCESQLGV